VLCRPGITESDLLVINKTDLAEAVGADLELMATQAKQMRSGSSSVGPVIFAQVKHMKGIPEIAELILQAWQNSKKYHEQAKQQAIAI
jgi:urease accessory protein